MAGLQSLRDIPHLGITEPVVRYDLGDELAQRFGTWTCGTACGIQELSTLVTRRLDKVRCEACLAAVKSLEGAP